jgi:Fic family protein
MFEPFGMSPFLSSKKYPPFNYKNVSNPYHIKNLQYYSTTVNAEVHSFNQLCDKVSSLTSLL